MFSVYSTVICSRLLKSLLLCCLLFALFVPLAGAQNKYTVSGIISDKLTGEHVIGATIKPLRSTNGVTSNDDGFYSLTLPAGNYTLQVSYVGYKTLLVNVALNKDLVINNALSVNDELNEVVISSARQQSDNISGTQMGVDRLDLQQINSVPVLLGEKDVLKTITLLPGVKTTSDANSGFYVRGGAADQNLILLDGAPVYNATHLFGFFSIFNSDAIKEVNLYKGGMPPSYGGRLSSVLDVKMDDGNKNNFGAEGGIGLISSRLKVEGPLVKGKSSFMISGRRTYADLFLRLSGDSSLKGSSLYFYDFNAKANYQFNNKNAIYLSTYYGKDNIGLKDNFASNWGNAIASLRWNHIYNNKLFTNTSLIYSNYNYTINNLSSTNIFDVQSRIRDASLKHDVTWFANPANTVTFGLAATRHNITPGNISASANSVYNSTHIENRYANEYAAYLANHMNVGTKITATYGLRLNMFDLRGPGTFNAYNDAGQVISFKSYSSGQSAGHYINVEPRVSINYAFNQLNAVKLSYNRNTQNVHLLSNSTAALPTDLYVLTSNNVKPGIADQLSLGYYRNFRSDMFELSAEVYYKKLQNQIDYKNNAQLIANENVESQLLYGVGRAYGLELYLKKRYGRFNGWLSYTLARAENSFAGIDNGLWYPARQDRRHNVSLVGIVKLNKRLTLSSAFIYGSGSAVTFPAGKYSVGGVTTYYYSSRNGYRLPSDHRLDLGLTLDNKPHKRFGSSWTFSIYNVYNHKNPYSVIFRDTDDHPPRTEAVETSLFGIIPSVTWNFKF